MADYASAISGIESGGNYSALGPKTKSGDQAYGKYQVMGANIPQWSQEALGKPLTPDQFLADPAAQDAIFQLIVDGHGQIVLEKQNPLRVQFACLRETRVGAFVAKRVETDDEPVGFV